MTTVSVILPSYNSQQWIIEAVQSVLSQTHQKLELIVIDDGSTDSTLNTLNAIKDDRLTIIEREHCSGGPATPRNEGVKAASGEYLAFIDSDDVWHPRKLELQLMMVAQYQLNFLSSAHINFRASPPLPPTLDDKKLIVQHKSHRQLLSKNWVITSSALVSKHLFKDIQFNQSKDYIGVEDYLAWLHIHQCHDIKSAVLSAPLVFYRLRQHSISASKRIMATKIYFLLSHYQYHGQALGWRALYYFSTYAFHSIKNRFIQR